MGTEYHYVLHRISSTGYVLHRISICSPQDNTHRIWVDTFSISCGERLWVYPVENSVLHRITICSPQDMPHRICSPQDIMLFSTGYRCSPQDIIHRICPPQDILHVPHRICHPQDNPHSCSPLWLPVVPHSRSPQDMSSTGYKVLWRTFTMFPTVVLHRIYLSSTAVLHRIYCN